MTEAISMADAKRKLRWNLMIFYFCNMLDDLFDTVSGYMAFALTVIFHIVALLLLGIEMLFDKLGWHAGAELTAALTNYYDWCMDEIEQRADSVSAAVGRTTKEIANVKRAAKAALGVDDPAVFSPSSCEAIIQKIQLTRESRKAVGVEFSALLVFTLQVATFMA